jgi:hypothetical protein
MHYHCVQTKNSKLDKHYKGKLEIPTSRASIKQRSTQSDAVEVTELMSLNSNVKHNISSGK